jgi:putative transposase
VEAQGFSPANRVLRSKGLQPLWTMNVNRTFFVTAVTWERRSIFQTERMSNLLVDTIYAYRKQGRYDLHEFVIMPDHIHLLLTPAEGIALEKCLQLIKRGFSFRAGKELSRMELWQESFTNHRVRDASDYAIHRKYILNNPVKRGLASSSEQFPWCSAAEGFVLDPPPQGPKPLLYDARNSQG